MTHTTKSLCQNISIGKNLVNSRDKEVKGKKIQWPYNAKDTSLQYWKNIRKQKIRSSE
jgi:hypothetical protein